mgnify:CR=1 FL=1
MSCVIFFFFILVFFQGEDGIRDLVRSRGLGDVYKRQSITRLKASYPLTDKQDLLAMAALEVTTRALNVAKPQPSSIDKEVLDELERLLNDLNG